MAHYSVQPRDRIFVKGYGFLSFVRNMEKIFKNLRNKKNLSSKCSQEVLDHAIKFPTDALKTASKEALQKTAEATGDLIDNTITNKITNVSRNSEQNSLETVTIIPNTEATGAPSNSDNKKSDI